MEEIKVADVTRYVSFYAYQSSDHISPATGITSQVVNYYLNNGARALMTSPTVTEKDATNMPGFYTLAVDESGMVSAAGVVSIRISGSGMDDVPIKVKIVGNTTKEVYDVVAHADYGNAHLVRSTTPANSLDIASTGEAGLDFDNIKDATGPHTLTDITIPICTTNTDMRGTELAALASEYTAARAVYLDYLSEGGVALASDIVSDISLETGISLVNSQTDFNLSSGSAVSDYYNDMVIIIYDTSENKSSRRIVTDYNHVLKTIIIDSAPDFTITTSDTVKIFEPSDFGDVPTAAENADAQWDEILTGGTHNVANSAGKRLREMFDAGIYEEETAQAGTSTTITIANTASAIDDYYNMMTLTIIDGTGAGQMRTFKDYDGSTKLATVCMAWSVSPDNTSKYVISAHACVGVFQMQSGVYDLINVECDTALTDYGANTTVPDAAGTAATLHGTTDGKVDALNDITVADIKAGIADGTYDLEEMIRLIFSACCLKTNGGGTTTLNFRNSADDKNRITETVDENGNRLSVTLDGSD